MHINNPPRGWENNFFRTAKILFWLYLGCALAVFNMLYPAGGFFGTIIWPVPKLTDPGSGRTSTPQENQLSVEISSTGGAQGIRQPASGLSPNLDQFVASVSDGDSRLARGVYLPGLFAFPIIQQPSDNPFYVSLKSDLVTQFKLAADHGVTGLLAHDYLAGREFYKLQPGQDVYIIYGDRNTRHYRISEIDTFQKIEPNKVYSDYIDLETGKRLSTSDVFQRFYSGAPHLTFQTCLEKDGSLSWGLLFITALPIAN